MKFFSKAFTLVEIMIIVVIFGLLMAMIIPACTTIRDKSIIKKAQSGQELTGAERVRYAEAMQRQPSGKTPAEQYEEKIQELRTQFEKERVNFLKEMANKRTQFEKLMAEKTARMNATYFQRITLDGNSYILIPIPSGEMKTTDINGHKFWLVPETAK